MSLNFHVIRNLLKFSLFNVSLHCFHLTGDRTKRSKRKEEEKQQSYVLARRLQAEEVSQSVQVPFVQKT